MIGQDCQSNLTIVYYHMRPSIFIMEVNFVNFLSLIGAVALIYPKPFYQFRLFSSFFGFWLFFHGTFSFHNEPPHFFDPLNVPAVVPLFAGCFGAFLGLLTPLLTCSYFALCLTWSLICSACCNFSHSAMFTGQIFFYVLATVAVLALLFLRTALKFYIVSLLASCALLVCLDGLNFVIYY